MCGRIKRCAAIALELPLGSVRTALENLEREYLRDLDALQQREIWRRTAAAGDLAPANGQEVDTISNRSGSLESCPRSEATKEGDAPSLGKRRHGHY